MCSAEHGPTRLRGMSRADGRQRKSAQEAKVTRDQPRTRGCSRGLLDLPTAASGPQAALRLPSPQLKEALLEGPVPPSPCRAAQYTEPGINHGCAPTREVRAVVIRCTCGTVLWIGFTASLEGQHALFLVVHVRHCLPGDPVVCSSVPDARPGLHECARSPEGSCPPVRSRA